MKHSSPVKAAVEAIEEACKAQEYKYLSSWVPYVITTNASITMNNDSTATTTTTSTTTIVEQEEMKEEGVLVAAAAAAGDDDNNDNTAIADAVAAIATDVDVDVDVLNDDVLDEDGIAATYGEYSQHRQSLSIHASFIKKKMQEDNEKKREILKMDIEQNYSERIMTHMNKDHDDSLIAYVLAFGTTGTNTTSSSNDGEEKEEQEEGQLPVVLAEVLEGKRSIVSAKLINVDIDGFLCEIVLRTEKDDYDNDNDTKNNEDTIVISNIRVPYDRTLKHPHELHGIAVAMHQKAYHKLGISYKMKHGYYRPALQSKAFQLYKAFHAKSTTTTTTTTSSNRMTTSVGIAVVGVAVAVAVAAYYYYDRNINNNNNKSSNNTSSNPCKVKSDDDCNGLLFS